MSEPPELTARHVNTALKEARRWARNAREKEDMEGVAVLALVQAWRAWDPARSPGGGKDTTEFFGYLLARVKWAVANHMQAANRLKCGAGKTTHALDVLVRGRKREYYRDRLAVSDPGPGLFELCDLLQRVTAGEDGLSVRCLRLFVDGMPQREIAARLGLPRTTVAWKITHLIKRLRARFPEFVEVP
jgi:hypothetical protein